MILDCGFPVGTPYFSFIETYFFLVYWQEIVVAVRSYAREKYGKEVLITANGMMVANVVVVVAVPVDRRLAPPFS